MTAKTAKRGEDSEKVDKIVRFLGLSQIAYKKASSDKIARFFARISTFYCRIVQTIWSKLDFAPKILQREASLKDGERQKCAALKRRHKTNLKTIRRI